MRAHHRRAYVRADGTQVSATDVAAHCQTNPTAYVIWNSRLRSKPSSRWLRRPEKPRNWTTEEKERVLDALSDLPPGLLADSVTALFRLEKSFLYDQNPASGEAGEIAIYDSAFKAKANLSRILAHEFAHEVFRQFSDTEKDQFRMAADWLLVKDPRAAKGMMSIPNRDSDQYVEQDGMESLTEDFSNDIDYFLFEPTVLRKKSPKVYDWIGKKFGDTFTIVRRAGR